MNRTDRIKLILTRNWNFPGKERLARWANPAHKLKYKMIDGIVWFNDEDIAIYASADNYIEYTVLTAGTYENEIQKLISISLNPGDTALDVGANIGIQSIRMSKCVGEAGHVYAFEPIAWLQDKFMKNIALNKCLSVTLIPGALSDQDGEALFKTNPGAWNQGTFSLGSTEKGTSEQLVSVKTGDDVPEVKKLKTLALIKIDVEGFEFQVLKGFKETLAKHKPRLIFEYDPHYWIKAGQSVMDCYSFLTALNYTLYQITPVGCQRINNPETIEGGNIFCLITDNGK